MNFFLTLAFLFFIGSTIGWGIEVIFRRFFSSANPERKWINPGFLNGPYLPLYGFGLCFLYLLASLEKISTIENVVLNRIVLFAAMAVAMTVIEYIAGIIFIKGMKIKLWDYSDEWGNIGGIICPKFSFFWAVLGAVYYFLIHPYILGLFFGVLLVDFGYSIKLTTRIRKFADDHDIVVKYEQLKETVRKSAEERKEKAKFIFSFRSEHNLAEQLEKYLERIKKR